MTWSDSLVLTLFEYLKLEVMDKLRHCITAAMPGDMFLFILSLTKQTSSRSQISFSREPSRQFNIRTHLSFWSLNHELTFFLKSYLNWWWVWILWSQIPKHSLKRTGANLSQPQTMSFNTHYRVILMWKQSLNSTWE